MLTREQLERISLNISNRGRDALVKLERDERLAEDVRRDFGEIIGDADILVKHFAADRVAKP